MVMRMFSSAVFAQALLSAANLLVSLILIRETADAQYGYYILVFGAIMLLVSLQNAFFGPPVAIRLVKLDRSGRRDLVGGLLREQRRMLRRGGVPLLLIAVAYLWATGTLDWQTGPLLAAAFLAISAALNREFFRMTLLAYRRTEDVLKADVVYAAMLVAGAVLAVLTPAPATCASLTLCASALVGGWLLRRRLRLLEGLNTDGAPHILREVAATGAWSAAGAGSHWAFSQGYSYLVAGVLGVASVASIAATRQLMMPVNLLSTGISSIMLPTISGLLNKHPASTVFRRLLLMSAGLAAAALLYLVTLWLLRDWVFSQLLRKNFAERDMLLLLWSGVFLTMVVRDQLLNLLAARERFRLLLLLTLSSAVVSLSLAYWLMLRVGVAGAAIGVLVGELCNVTGIVVFSLREQERRVAMA
jgi:O-antigen/teichoic acid export membrane protein